MEENYRVESACGNEQIIVVGSLQKQQLVFDACYEPDA
jgi:hypothetical protein